MKKLLLILSIIAYINFSSNAQIFVVDNQTSDIIDFNVDPYNASCTYIGSPGGMTYEICPTSMAYFYYSTSGVVTPAGGGIVVGVYEGDRTAGIKNYQDDLFIPTGCFAYPSNAILTPTTNYHTNSGGCSTSGGIGSTNAYTVDVTRYASPLTPPPGLTGFVDYIITIN